MKSPATNLLSLFCRDLLVPHQDFDHTQSFLRRDEPVPNRDLDLTHFSWWDLDRA